LIDVLRNAIMMAEVSDIPSDSHRTSANLRNRRVKGILASRRDDDLRSFCGEQLSRGYSDPAIPARDKRDFVRKGFHIILL
jgi:hypothetical protein